MASKIEHHAKRSAHMDTVMWAKSDLMNDKKGIMHLPTSKYKSHAEYCEEMKKNGKYYHGSPPRSKILNWLGHKLLEIAWGKSLYL